MNVSLTPELEWLVADQVASGRYQSASEVVRQGLRLLDEQESRRKAALDELRELISAGLAEAKRGELLDGEQFVADLLQRNEG